MSAVPTRVRSMPRKRKSVDTGIAKPVYLVVEHETEEPSHSIVIAGARTQPAVVPLRHAKRGMSFAAMDSRWIVGVGGDSQCHSTIYDLATSTESGGPPTLLLKNKVNPVLIPHRGMLYVLSRRPKIYLGADFLPWFEVFTFRGDGRVPRLEDDAPSLLPPPPIFPYCINPLEYLNPPDVHVAAYAVVDSHILLSVSFQQHHQEEEPEEVDKGTCAFDMDRQVWEMVDDKSLPFLGQAMPLGNHLFVARSKERDDTAAVYSMAVIPAKDAPTGKSELSIVELPLDLPKGRPIVPGQHLRALGNGIFSSFDVRSSDDDEKTRVVQRTYSLVKGGDDTSSTNLKVVRWQRQIFKLLDLSYFLARPAPVVAAFTV